MTTAPTDNPLVKLCHKMVAQARRQGIMIQQPCEVCGLSGAVAHHDDYSKPLDVKWLCVSHHLQLHAELRRNADSPVHRYARHDPRLTQWDDWVRAGDRYIITQIRSLVERLGIERAADTFSVPGPLLERWWTEIVASDD